MRNPQTRAEIEAVLTAAGARFDSTTKLGPLPRPWFMRLWTWFAALFTALVFVACSAPANPGEVAWQPLAPSPAPSAAEPACLQPLETCTDTSCTGAWTCPMGGTHAWMISCGDVPADCSTPDASKPWELCCYAGCKPDPNRDWQCDGNGQFSVCVGGLVHNVGPTCRFVDDGVCCQ